ncbi:MAG: AAA family ATPase [Alphaproteobacteria bacterium]|nr:AAA family ATPase [Alphaproteobacteria bacterium]
MSGAKDRFKDRGELDQFSHDLDLDMDAPIGAAFAAALRDPSGDIDSAEDEVDALSDEGFDDDGFLTSTSSLLAAKMAFEAAPAAHSPHPADAREPAADDLPPPPEASPDTVPDSSSGLGSTFDYAFAPSDSGGDRMIPRIAFHAFCVRTQMLGLMRTIQKDRRMSNVSMEVFEGGIQTAIDYYVNETAPNLIVVEATGEPRQLLSELDALAEHCDENIRVVVVGHTNDIRLYRELMRRGVSEYLVAPVDPVQMIRSIAGLFADPETPFVGKTLAVTGVKGGVGASSIAHNLAWALSERVKVNATLVDLDLNFGTTGLDFNEDAGATIADALMSADRFDEAIMGRLISKATERLSLFTAPATLDRTYNLDPDTYGRVLEQVRASVPFVVLDLPHIWADWFKSTIISADEIVVVAGPDLASLRNGKNLIDFLKAARPNDAPPKLVLNMVGLPKRPEIPAKDFGSAIGVEPTLVLPFDAHLFGTAANNGQMIFDVAPDSKCAQGLDQLATLLSGREIQAAKPSLLKKLMGR